MALHTHRLPRISLELVFDVQEFIVEMLDRTRWRGWIPGRCMKRAKVANKTRKHQKRDIHVPVYLTDLLQHSRQRIASRLSDLLSLDFDSDE